MLVTSKELLEIAKKEKFAIPAANFFDSSSARAYVKTAERLNKPLILAFAQGHMTRLSLEESAVIGGFYAKNASVPVVLHLDHGQDEEVIKKAIDLGFSSVMIDASQDVYEENVRRSKVIADYAHKFGVSVEAEIGHVGSGTSNEFEETTQSIYTEVEQAEKFAKETGVDSLAVSIGTAHGQYKGEPKISFERLNEIHEQVTIPLVLHGGSSSGDDNLAKCAKGGIAKINIFTDFCLAATKAIYSKQYEDIFEQREAEEQAIEKTLEHYYKVFGTKEITI